VEIIHPYFTEEDDNEQKIYRKVKATWDGEIRDGVPHGLGYIKYSHEEEGVRVLIRAVETLVTRINLLRIADEKTAKSYPFYKAVKLPMAITPDDVKSILVEQKQVNESWRHLYT
jgi:hypothetical protein